MQAPLQSRNASDAAQTETAKKVTQKRVLTDNRPEAVAQRKLAEMMNNSPRLLQQRALSDTIHNSPRMVAQRHEMNALFGGAVKPQGDGAMPAEASRAQREEKTNNTGLPNQLKSGIESLSGISMDDVTVHYNSDKPAQLQAHAYAQGSEIHVGAGHERHLPHEAWHVVQQAQGRVRPTLQMKAGAINDDPSLEKEADMMGENAAQFKGDHDARNLVAEERVPGAVTQHVAGFRHDTTLVVQRFTQVGKYKWSVNNRFATNGNRYIGAIAGALPALSGARWETSGQIKRGKGAGAVALTLQRPRWHGSNKNNLVKVPKDCITTAEMVAAWLTLQDPSQVGSVKVNPTIAQATPGAAMQPGEILFHVHSNGKGDFHAAAVIATDSDDVVTMESDASSGNKIISSTPLFDMYAGNAGFRTAEVPVEVNKLGNREHTYVIRFADVTGRVDPVVKTLWADVQAQMEQGYSSTGKTAAVQIRTAIQTHLAANAMNAAANQPPDADNQQPGAVNQPADAANQPAAAADQMDLSGAQ